MCVVVAPGETLRISGKFWRPLGPVSASPGSLRVTPALASNRSIPRGWFPKNRFPRMVVASPPTEMPLKAAVCPLYAITFPSPGAIPPMIHESPPVLMPDAPLPRSSVPVSSVPMKLPRTMTPTPPATIPKSALAPMTLRRITVPEVVNWMPDLLPSGRVPVTSVPMKLPSMVRRSEVGVISIPTPP